MKHFYCVQGSDEWLRLRMGKPTASDFDKLITAKKWEPTKGETRKAYAIYLLTELILDMPLSNVTTAAMQHGNTMEESARTAYEMLAGQEVERCGFCTNDEQTYGASPDAFVGEDGSLEIKSPWKPEIHVGYLFDNQSFVDEYFVQTQGQLFVTGRKWTDLISYFSGMPMVKVRVLPHPEFQEKLAIAVNSFCASLSDLIDAAMERGWLKERPATRGWITQGDVDMVRKRKQHEGDFDLSEQDIRAILEARREHVS